MTQSIQVDIANQSSRRILLTFSVNAATKGKILLDPDSSLFDLYNFVTSNEVFKTKDDHHNEDDIGWGETAGEQTHKYRRHD